VYSPKTKINLLAGAVLGVVLGVLIVAVMEWLEAGVVRSTEDLERIEIPAMGAIPVESGKRR
jgi:capsular polysaccharide biosynthesis protein